MLQRSNELFKVLNNLKDNVEFYKNLIPSDIGRWEDNNEKLEEVLLSLPIIQKTEMKNSYSQFLNNQLLQNGVEFLFDKNLPRNFNKVYTYTLRNGLKIIVSFTSGSSGVPFMIIREQTEQLMIGKTMWNMRNKFSSIIPHEMFNFLHTENDEKYPFNFEKLEDEGERIRKELDYLLYGSNYKWWHMHFYDIEKYYSFVTTMNYPIKHGSQLQVIENNGVYMSYEDRERIKNTFSCEIADFYGCQECWMISYTCKEAHHHINEDNILFELVDERGEVIHNSSKPGRVVITTKKQHMMPFVRYAVGDRAVYMDGECGCGSQYRRIKLLPNRDRIIGTKIYGNKFFQEVIWCLTSVYKVVDFHSVHISQYKRNEFIVNFCACNVEKNSIERAFLDAVKHVSTIEADYRVAFTYNDEVHDTLFSVETANK